MGDRTFQIPDDVCPDCFAIGDSPHSHGCWAYEPPPDPRDARIAELEAALAGLVDALRNPFVMQETDMVHDRDILGLPMLAAERALGRRK